MLKGIDPLLNAEVLGVLRAMGHGDMLILSDANFPTEAVAAETVHGVPLRIDRDMPEVGRAVLSVLPLDTFVDDFAARMEVVGDPDAVPEVQAEMQEIIAGTGETRAMVSIERFAFYDLAREAYAVIQTSERRFYGCFMLRKGVISPDE
ncbi:MAG: RbsD/FucU domain-containing protein [Pseudomonadota bacterium]